jgi:hypothetical protein
MRRDVTTGMSVTQKRLHDGAAVLTILGEIIKAGHAPQELGDLRCCGVRRCGVANLVMV